MWDAEVECAEPADEAALIAARLPEQLAYVARTSPFYRDLWRSAGVDATQVRTQEDLARLPFTEKDDLRRSQDATPPFGGTRCCERSDSSKRSAVS